jgi:tetratricopeptide (TPR) repeat protein
LEDKSFGLLAIGEGVAESNQTKKALDLIPQIILNIELSKWNDLKLLVKVRVGKIFLKANKINEAKKLFNEVIENTSSLKVYENIFADQLWEEIIDAYKSKGLFDDSIKTLLAYKETNSLNSNDYAVKNLIEIYFLSNNTVEANKLMYQLGSSSEELDKLWVAEKYLQIGDVQAANDILLSLKIDTWQQDLSIQISEYYQKKSKLAFAIDVLNQAFARAEKINSNEPELAMMSTSPARQKASFMADIAKQFIKLNRLDLASIVINEIEKPYFKAQSLIKFAQNKNKKDANRILDQTLLLMKQNEDSNLDASKHENWNEIALAYKKIGQKEKSIEVFDQILNMERFNREKSTDSEIISGLAETGYYFTKSRVENNTKITNSLRKIMNIWAEGN